MQGRYKDTTWSRMGYNGSAKDDEVYGKGNLFTTEFREGDTRTLRWWSKDPKQAEFPWQTSYSYMNGNPVTVNDPNGDAPPGGAAAMKLVQGAKVFELHPVVQLIIKLFEATEVGNPEGTATWKAKQKMIGQVAMANAKADQAAGAQKEEEESKIPTRREALQKAKEHAQVPRDSRGGEDIPLDDVKPSSRGKNWEQQKANGATQSGRRGVDKNGDATGNSWQEHPDGHPDAGQEGVPAHHDGGHFHSTNRAGESKVIPYK